jgi:hypothetical protein
MPPLGLFSLIRFERVGKGATNGQGRTNGAAPP